MTFPMQALGEVGVCVLDCEHKTPPAQPSGYPYIAIPQLRGGVIYVEGSRLISASDFLEWTRRTKPVTGDVVVTRRGRVGDTAPIPPGLDCAIGQNLVILRSDGSQVDQTYLRWAARSPFWRSEVDRLVNVGAVFSSLNVRDIARIRIPVPPIVVQRGIALTLNAFNDRIESNRRQRELLRQLGKAKVFDAISKAAPRPALLSDLTTSISRGVTPKYADNDPSTALVINQKCVRENWVSVEPARRMFFREIAPAKKVSDGDVVVNSTGTGTLGRVGRWHSGIIFADSHISIVKPDTSRIGPTVLAYLMFDRESEIEAMATGSTGQTELSATRLGELPIEVPDRSVAADLEDTLIAIEDRAASLRSEDRLLEACREVLLPGLLSGRIRVAEAEEVVA